MVSLLQDMQESDQRMTMLQLIDKMKIKHKELGWFYAFNSLSTLLNMNKLDIMYKQSRATIDIMYMLVLPVYDTAAICSWVIFIHRLCP